MNNLFYGLLLVFLDFNLSFNDHTFELLPDFLGYYLMMRGLEELDNESDYFAKARPFAMGMMIYTAVLYALDVLAVTVYLEFVSWVLGLLATIVSLVIGYWVVSGIQDIETRHGWDLQGQRLRSMWLYTAVLQGIAYVCVWIPWVSIMGSLAAFIMGICYLVAFNSSRKLYQAHF